MRVDCGFKGHERNASIFIGFPLQMARNQFEGNLTWVRIPPAAPDNDNPNPVPVGDGFGFLVYLKC